MSKQEYIKSLVEGKTSVTGMEATALSQMLSTASDIEKTEQKVREIEQTISQLNNERERAHQLLMAKRGCATGLADLLWAVEDERRQTK